MKESTKQVYKCDFCAKTLLVKNAMIRHEDQCKKNPINFHPCFDCIHFVVEEGFNEQYYEGGGEIHTRDIPYKKWECAKKGIVMHTRRAFVKKLIERCPENFIDTELMPIYCVLQTPP